MQARKWIAVVVAIGVSVAAIVYWHWRQDAPRRACLDTATQLCSALNSGDTTKLLETVALPDALLGRTAAEQSEFLRKALADEISPEGLAMLRRDGQFGPLTNIFPAEATQWASQAGVNVGNCVAFKLERPGLRAELVLAGPSSLNSQPSTAFRIVRCNNIKQLAEAHQP